MNEMLDSQLSAMFDDELPTAECELLARRLARDESLKARWRHYAVIGAAMRGEQGVALNVELAARVRGIVAAEPALSGSQGVGVRRQGRVSQRIWQGVAGAAVAAGVAAVSIFWLRNQSQPETPTLLAQRPADFASSVLAAAEEDVPNTYVVPTTIDAPALVPTAELANYVVAHSEYSSPLSRRNLLSSLVASESGTVPFADGSEEPLRTVTPREPSESMQTYAPDAQDTP